MAVSSGLLQALFLAVLCLAVSGQGNDWHLISEGVYGGRGGSIVLRSTDAATNDACVMFSDPAGHMGEASKSTAAVAEVDLISGVAGAIGMQSPAGSVAAAGASKESLLNKKARLSVLVAIDGLGESDIAPGTTPYLGAFAVAHPGVRPLEHSSYPFSAATTLTNVLTGHTPASHGIVAGSWRTSGDDVNAYSSAQTESMRGSLADVLTQTFAGKSLTVAAGADRTLARAAGPHLRLHSARNVLLWAGATGAVEANSKALLKDIGSQDALMSLVSDLNGSVSAAGSATTVTVSGVVAEYKSASPALLALNEDLSILRSVAALLRLSSNAGSVEVYEAIHDNVPDYIAVVASSLKALAAEYPAAGAPQLHAAQLLIDEGVRDLMLAVHEAYGSAYVATFLALGKEPAVPSADVMALTAEVVTAAVPAAVIRGPVVFTPRHLHADHLKKVCDALTDKLATKNAKAYCIGAEPVFLEMNAGLDMRTMGFMSSDDLTRNVTATEIIEYQMFFWFWVAFLVALFSSICMLAYMPVQKDTLLYPANEFEFEKLD